ncbi:MAG: cytochrome C [Arcobacteraceae bacterium]|nr:cytochrome C [Arcobacteraceae bacterium]
MRILAVLILLVYNLFASSVGEVLFNGNCLACHNIKTEASAPSMMDIKDVYLDIFPKKEDFVNFMTNWVSEPEEDTAFMLNAIDKYGLMPNLHYEQQMIEDISIYIYDTDFSKID